MVSRSQLYYILAIASWLALDIYTHRLMFQPQNLSLSNTAKDTQNPDCFCVENTGTGDSVCVSQTTVTLPSELSSNCEYKLE